MIVADTDVLIDFLAGREPAAARVARELERSNLWTTVITRFEMLSGARGAREMQIVSGLLDSVKIAPLDISAADRAAAVRRALERKGVGIGMADSLRGNRAPRRRRALNAQPASLRASRGARSCVSLNDRFREPASLAPVLGSAASWRVPPLRKPLIFHSVFLCARVAERQTRRT